MFLNPFFLIGALAAGVPLAIHLMHKQHSRVIRWPSLRFLKASDRRTARRRQVEELLLLLLRMALLAFLSVALSRPIIRAAGIGGGGEGAVVVVLDNSMSTSALAGQLAPGSAGARLKAGESTSFAVAKRAAEEVLRSSPDGRAALRLADGTEPPAAHAISRNREAVATALRAASASDARGDLGACVVKGIADAAASGAAGPEVHVLTDFQAAAFKGALLPRFSGTPVQLFFVDCGAGVTRNVAVTAASVNARRLVAGVPLGIDVVLQSFSPDDEERRVVLEIDPGEGEEATKARTSGPLRGATFRAERLVTVAPRGSLDLSFQVTLDRAGERTGRVYISPGDELPPDDVRYFRVHLAERIPVLVIEHGKSAVASARPAFFIAAALDPRRLLGAVGETSRSPIVPKVTGIGYLKGRAPRSVLAESPVVILADLAEIEEKHARAWVEYVRVGGTLVAFPSAAGGLERAARTFAKVAGAPFLPAEVGGPAGDVDSRAEPRRIDVERADLRHEEVLEPFRDLDATLRAVKVWRAYELRASHAAGGRAVLSLDDGNAFLAARKFGEGEVFVFAVPAGTEWSDLPARSLFLPLVHTLVHRAYAPREGERSFLAGRSAHVPMPPGMLSGTGGAGRKRPELAGKAVRLTEPGGRRSELVVSERDDGSAELVIERLARAGVYRVEKTTSNKDAQDRQDRDGDGDGDGDGKDRLSYPSCPSLLNLVANTDPEESDPARLGPARLRELYRDAAGVEPVFVKDPADIPAALRRARKGVELWDYFLAFVLGIALFECFFSNRLAAGASGRFVAGAASGRATGT